MINKETQAMLNQARTRQLLADTDLKDLEFTNIADGTKHAREVDLKRIDHKAVMDKAQSDNFTKIAIEANKPRPAK